MMRTVLRSRRAVSPVVSSLILIFITIAGFGLMVTTTNQWISLQRVNEMQTISERVIIEDAWFQPEEINNKSIRLAVTNTGEIEVKLRYIKVNEITLWRREGGDLVSVERGGTELVNVSLGSPWTNDKRYLIRVITDRGNRFEAVFWSPS